ncbi:hypothetical protein D3C80_456970 [compost metagenome]
MDDRADVADGFFEHAVGRRVGDHQCGEVLAVLDGFGTQVVDVDVAAGVTGGHHHAHAGHVGGGRVGAVGRGRDQADIAAGVATALVVSANGQQAGVFTLGAGIGLQRHGVIAGGGAEHRFQLVGQLLVALALLSRCERVQVAELGPGHRNHFAGGIELHGARTQRDHGAVQRQVLVGQAAQVAHQLGFAVVAVKHRMLKNCRLTQEVGRQLQLNAGGQGAEFRNSFPVSEQLPQRFDISLSAGFIQRQAQALSVDLAQVQALSTGLVVQGCRGVAGGQGQGVEERFGFDTHTDLLETGGEDRGQCVSTLGDLLQALWTVVHGVHAGDVGQQYLSGADVAGSFLATDMLLAGLHGQTQGGLAEAID